MCERVPACLLACLPSAAAARGLRARSLSLSCVSPYLSRALAVTLKSCVRVLAAAASAAASAAAGGLQVLALLSSSIVLSHQGCVCECVCVCVRVLLLLLQVDSKCEMSGGHPEMGVLLVHTKWLEQARASR